MNLSSGGAFNGALSAPTLTAPSMDQYGPAAGEPAAAGTKSKGAHLPGARHRDVRHRRRRRGDDALDAQGDRRRRRGQRERVGGRGPRRHGPLLGRGCGRDGGGTHHHGFGGSARSDGHGSGGRADDHRSGHRHGDGYGGGNAGGGARDPARAAACRRPRAHRGARGSGCGRGGRAGRSALQHGRGEVEARGRGRPRSRRARRATRSESGRVVIVFAPNGGAQTATVTGPPFEGTPTGACVAARFRGVHVPPFSGSPFSVDQELHHQLRAGPRRAWSRVRACSSGGPVASSARLLLGLAACAGSRSGTGTRKRSERDLREAEPLASCRDGRRRGPEGPSRDLGGGLVVARRAERGAARPARARGARAMRPRRRGTPRARPATLLASFAARTPPARTQTPSRSRSAPPASRIRGRAPGPRARRRWRPTPTLRRLDAWLAEVGDPRLRRCAVASGVGARRNAGARRRRGGRARGPRALADAGSHRAVARGERAPARAGERGRHPRARSERRAAPGARRGSTAATLHARFALDRPGAFTVQVAGHDRERSAAGRSRRASSRTSSRPRARSCDRAPGEDARRPGARTTTRSRACSRTARTASGRAAAGARRAARRARARARAAHGVGARACPRRRRRRSVRAPAGGGARRRRRSARTSPTRRPWRSRTASLWASPSHRANMLRRDFDRVGVAAARDDRGDAVGRRDLRVRPPVAAPVVSEPAPRALLLRAAAPALFFEDLELDAPVREPARVGVVGLDGLWSSP